MHDAVEDLPYDSEAMMSYRVEVMLKATVINVALDLRRRRKTSRGMVLVRLKPAHSDRFTLLSALCSGWPQAYLRVLRHSCLYEM